MSLVHGCPRPNPVLGKDARIARLILINGPPASGKSTLARRYVDEHDGSALVEVDALRMTVPDWETDEASRLEARALAGAAVVGHLAAGREVVMAQYFGRLGYLALLDDMARQHQATFVEVVLLPSAQLAADRFRARRRDMARRGERHPERDIADGDIDAVILDAVDRLTRLPTARPGVRMVAVGSDSSEDEVYASVLAVVGRPDR